MKRRIFDFIPFYIHFYVSQDRPDHSAWQSQVWCHGKPTQATCKYHLSATQPDLHLQSTELYLRLDWPPPHLQTENGCISQHCHHPHHLPSRAGRQHLSARHDHHLPGGSPGPHRHQWPGKLASVIQRVISVLCLTVDTSGTGDGKCGPWETSWTILCPQVRSIAGQN